jgi:glycosyltransferase involved in cell wall biosynthesis
MRVAQVLDTSSRLAGGMFESVKGLAQAMIAAGDDVVVLSGTDAWSAIDRASWGPAAPQTAPTSGLADGILGTALTGALIAAEPDLVHLHGIWGVGARATAAWARRTRRPVIISPRGMLDPWALRRSAAKKRVSQWLWEGRLLRDARFLHALNASEAESIRVAGWARPIVTIPNGTALPELGNSIPGNDGPRILLFVGRLHPKKGLEELIRSWALLPPGLRDRWTLKIAGWDEVGLLANLVSLAQALGVEHGIEFMGPVYGEEKDAVFRSASAFILPSYSEGLPMAVLEAWSYELPVFMTAACNLPKGFAAGAAFEIGTAPEAITPALVATLEDQGALSAAGRNGRALVEQGHGWPMIARDMRAAYVRALQ